MNSPRPRITLIALAGVIAGAGVLRATPEDDFEALAALPTEPAFFDDCTGDWEKQWFLDGLRARVETGPDGMALHAGPEELADPDHAVLWTRRVFEGDLRIDYEYTRLDEADKWVNILYIEATGSGEGPYATDIAEWAELREVPSMASYFNNMNLYHVSYAAFGGGGENYVRARRYLPLAGKGLDGTQVEPSYDDVDLRFATGVPHAITVIKRGSKLAMRVVAPDMTRHYSWDASEFPPVTEGRIGLRHMWTRSARYKDFTVARIVEDGD